MLFPFFSLLFFIQYQERERERVSSFMYQVIKGSNDMSNRGSCLPISSFRQHNTRNLLISTILSFSPFFQFPLFLFYHFLSRCISLLIVACFARVCISSPILCCTTVTLPLSVFLLSTLFHFLSLLFPFFHECISYFPHSKESRKGKSIEKR